MTILLLSVTSVSLVLTANALMRPSRRGPWPLWVPALVTGELAPWQAVFVGAVVWLTAVVGPVSGLPGAVGMVFATASGGGLAVVHGRALRARGVIRSAVAEALGEVATLPLPRYGSLLRPMAPIRRSVVVTSDLRYGPDPDHRADVYRSRHAVGDLPVMVQVHGGGWTGGSKERQARPLINHMTALGWTVVAVTYRTSPRATFPDHLADVRRAIAWVRGAAERLGADPSFVAVSGGSAGGQLAALTALAEDDPTRQDSVANAVVQACVAFYGVHDLQHADGRPKWPYLASHVLKQRPADDPELWRRASPVRMASPGRPSFLLLHGSHDSVVPASDSRRLASALRAVGNGSVGYGEVPGANHGFDYFASLRGAHAAVGVGVFLERLYARGRVVGPTGTDDHAKQ